MLGEHAPGVSLSASTASAAEPGHWRRLCRHGSTALGGETATALRHGQCNDPPTRLGIRERAALHGGARPLGFMAEAAGVVDQAEPRRADSPVIGGGEGARQAPVTG